MADAAKWLGLVCLAGLLIVFAPFIVSVILSYRKKNP